MAKSKIVPVRLSNAELETFEKYQKKIGINSQSDFLRYSAAFFISITEVIAKVVSSKDIPPMLENAIIDLQNELQKVPVTKSNLREKFELVENTIMPKIEQEIDKGVELVKPFAQKRSAGRPSKPKFSRGRPKEQEYGK